MLHFRCGACGEVFSAEEINNATARCLHADIIVRIDDRWLNTPQFFAGTWWICPGCMAQVFGRDWHFAGEEAGGRVRYVTCVVCKSRVFKVHTKKVPKVGYVCPACYGEKSYGTKNTFKKGRPRKDGLTFSIEFETSRTTDECYYLLRHGFIPTHDGSIGGSEWKSPIYQNLQAFRPVCFGLLNRLAELVGRDCGTHIHVGVPPSVKYFVQDCWVAIFGPLVLYMRNKPDETKQFWGRCFNGYAQDKGVDRYSAFSAWSSCTTLEFRLPKFRDAEQFYRVVKFCLKVTKMIVRAHQSISDYTYAPLRAARLGLDILRAYQKEVGWLASPNTFRPWAEHGIELLA